jgi:NADPH:quinone reductase-like Zn-dependent oxidoreductase
VRAPEDKLAPKPASLTVEQAAAVAMGAAPLRFRSLDRVRLRADLTILASTLARARAAPLAA